MTPKRTTPSKSTTSEEIQGMSETTDDAQQRKADSLARNDTQRNSNASRTTQTKTSITAFKKKWQTESRSNRRRQPRQGSFYKRNKA